MLSYIPREMLQCQSTGRYVVELILGLTLACNLMYFLVGQGTVQSREEHGALDRDKLWFGGVE